jgi:hypothetical protein
MSDFVESVKNIASAAVSRTSWEAQKQLRVRSKQSEVDKLMEQRYQLLDELAQAALNLYQQGRLPDPQMSRLCASIIELDADVKNHEVQLQEIKSESYSSSQFAPAPTTDYTPPPASHSTSAPQNAPGATPGTSAGMQTVCPNCGNPVRPNALYCRSCGTKLR